MKGFGAAGIVFFIITVVFLVYMLGNINIKENNPVETNINEMKIILEDQNKTYYYAKNGIAVYCNEFMQYENISLKSKTEDCNISFKDLKTKNCINDMMNITYNFFKNAEIKNETIESNILDYKYLMDEKNYKCDYEIYNHNIEGCDAERTFQIECYSPYEIETDVGFQEMKLVLKGGAS